MAESLRGREEIEGLCANILFPRIIRVLLKIEAFVLYKELTSKRSKTTWSKKRFKAARMQALSDRRWRVGVQQEESSMVPLLPTTHEQIGNKYCHYLLTINMLLCYHLFTLKMYH